MQTGDADYPWAPGLTSEYCLLWAAEKFPSKAILDSHLVFLILETERANGKIRITKMVEEMLLALRDTYTAAELKKFHFFAPSVDDSLDSQELKRTVKEILKFGQSDILEVNSTDSATESIHSLVIKHSKCNIERIVDSMKDTLLRVQREEITVVDDTNNDLPKETIANTILGAIDTFSDLKRILSSETKQNEVTPELQEKFHTMKNLGYAGHVYINKTLIIFVQENSNEKVKEALKKSAEVFFDHVTCSPLISEEPVRQFTHSLKHDQRIESQHGRRGRIGAFARQNNKTVALTVPHLATCGTFVRKDESVIGTCIWPPSQPHDVLMNRISVIEMKAEWQSFCQIMHENMKGDMRPFTLHLAKPSQFQKVYKGRLNTGFITGRIVSSEANLPLGESMIRAYLVEGDDELPFANTGDSGVVVKLQQEVDGKLHGLSMVFGGVLDLPGIEPDICITIPLVPAVNEYEQQTNIPLLFQ
ncbi:hypothetical protein FSP39_004546 [Pinctada imbricata]|uniref:Uncharacterized protein n=1 Tax=Pinctada imbricata TaxID=66713 RepID=A0AA88YDL1_PINIB|nr:hypothetical protein FSP39_004546 [Pinctada imbricata]